MCVLKKFGQVNLVTKESDYWFIFKKKKSVSLLVRDNDISM